MPRAFVTAMWNATVIAGNAGARLRALEASGGAALAIEAERERVVARHLLGLDHLFSDDDVEGCLVQFEAAARTWQQATASTTPAGIRKSWSMAFEGAIVGGHWDLAGALAERTAPHVVPPEYEDEFAAAACLQICCRAGDSRESLARERARIERLCDGAEQYLGGPAPVFGLFRAMAVGSADFAQRFAAWHEQHVLAVDERLAGNSLRPFEVMLSHCWTPGLAVLRCAQRSGVDVAATGLLTPRRFLPASLLAVIAEANGG